NPGSKEHAGAKPGGADVLSHPSNRFLFLADNSLTNTSIPHPYTSRLEGLGPFHQTLMHLLTRSMSCLQYFTQSYSSDIQTNSINSAILPLLLHGFPADN
uniref:Uncharacterized protein n=1 Tax=Poecilia latipinna TaxID=48699 RepID=A0A3B3VST3_9TELE